MVHRLEYESTIGNQDIRRGQVLRITLKNSYLEHTGFVSSCKEGVLSLSLTTGLDASESKEFLLTDIETVTEILSSPLFYRFRNFVKGDKAGLENIL